MKTNIIISVFLAISFLFSPIHSAFAHTEPTNYLPKLSNWTSYGTTNVGFETVKLTGSSSGWVYVDIDASKLNGSYTVIASHAIKSDSRTYNVSTQRSSGNPYMYVYLMNSKNKIEKYITADAQMSSSRTDSDRVVYGIFPVDTNTKTIRLFLKQSSIKNVSNTGANVTFTNPVLYSASSKVSVQTLLDEYAGNPKKEIVETNTQKRKSTHSYSSRYSR